MHLRGYVGGWDFDAEYVDYILNKYKDQPVNVLIDSLGGELATALSIVASFRRHGNVHVHFVGMNASAATIASMGAKSITMDSSAMYLVHKCSVDFFKWAEANSDKLAEIIKEAEQKKTDLEKMDLNVAQLYASKCKKKTEDLLALMKKGGWLTAQEAMEYGFVDEITSFDEDEAPIITDSIAADMMASGIPVPAQVAKNMERKKGFFARTFDLFAKMFEQEDINNHQNNQNMKKETTQQTEAQEQQTETQEQQTEAQEQQTETQEQQTETQEQQTETQEQQSETQEQQTEVEALRRENETLRAEIKALRDAPGDKTKKIVEANKTTKEDNAYAQYVNTEVNARELYNAIKR